MLGERLENDQNEGLSKNAELCYICAGNLSKVVGSWLRRDKTVTADNLQVACAFYLKNLITELM